MLVLAAALLFPGCASGPSPAETRAHDLGEANRAALAVNVSGLIEDHERLLRAAIKLRPDAAPGLLGQWAERRAEIERQLGTDAAYHASLRSSPDAAPIH